MNFKQRSGLFIGLIIFFLHAYATSLPPDTAIATAHPLATKAGFKIIEQGGNAFDVAVAVTAVLAVVEPYSSGLGGGGFYLLHRARDQFEVMIDAREKAPGAAHEKLYLDDHGEIISGLSTEGPLAAGIPGIPAALVHLAEKYGKLPLKESLTPAITLANEGFEVDALYQKKVTIRLQALQKNSEAAQLFLKDAHVPPIGHRIVQRDLASTLHAIVQEGRIGFYEGHRSQMLVDGVRAGGGIWSVEDLKKYHIVERQPITGKYQNITLTTAPPPSSGGIALITILNILDTYPLHTLSSAQRKHLIVEAMRRAYLDRAKYLGDPDFVSIPTERLTHPLYAQGLRAGIHGNKATTSDSLPGPVNDLNDLREGDNTTHFSILDRAGNRVAATLSINYFFGACFVPPHTGVLLNNEMDDFVAKPGLPNTYGLIGADANAIKPGKRPLSSMTPTFLDGPNGVAILGTPGGSRIITMVLLGILSYADGNKPQQWVTAPRFHHQYLPDVIQYEAGALSEQDIKKLSEYGHHLEVVDTYGNMQAILWDKKNNTLDAASDPRGLASLELLRSKNVLPIGNL